MIKELDSHELTLKVASCNVQGLTQLKLHLLLDYMKSHSVDVMTLQETWLRTNKSYSWLEAALGEDFDFFRNDRKSVAPTAVVGSGGVAILCNRQIRARVFGDEILHRSDTCIFV